jgi:hypothetical protein
MRNHLLLHTIIYVFIPLKFGGKEEFLISIVIITAMVQWRDERILLRINNEIGNEKMSKTHLVGKRESHVLQQFLRFGGAICTSHCLSFSSAKGSPGCRTSGFCIKLKMTCEFFYAHSFWSNLLNKFCVLPLQMLHYYRYRVNPMLRLNWLALARVASSSCSLCVYRRLDLLFVCETQI